MVNLLLVGIFTLIFAFITLRRFEWGLFLLFLLLPTYLLRFQIGPIPSTFLEIMLLIIILVFIFKNIKKTKRNLLFETIKKVFTRHTLLFWGIALFILGATISIFTSVDIKSAAGEWRAFYIEPILLFVTLTLFFKTVPETQRKKTIHHSILFPLIISGLITALFAIYQHATGFFVPHAFWANRETYRVTAWYGFPNAVGLFLTPIIPLTLWFLTEKWKHFSWYHPFLSFPILFLITAPFALLFAKGSGPLIGLLGAIGWLFLFYKKTRIPTIILGVMLGIGIFFLPANHAIKQELFAQNYSGKIRRDMWNETWQLLTDRPIVGTGIASYEERILPYRGDRWIEVFHHPHNIFLTIWVNTGIIGLLGFVLILFAFFKNALQNFPFVTATMVSILIMGLVDSPYIKNDLAILFWLLPTLVFSVYTPKTKKPAA